MKLLNEKLALNIIINGESNGSTYGQLINDKLKITTPVDIYYRNYKGKKYEIAEVEIYDKETNQNMSKFYEVSKKDYTTEDSKIKRAWEDTFTGIKNNLNDVVNLLKN